MKYIDKINEQLLKEFFEKYLSHKNLTFCKMQKQPFGVFVRYCYNENYTNLHNMTFFDYHVSSVSGVWVSKLWKAFMYEKFGEQYLKDFEDYYLTDFKSSYKRKYKEFVEKIKSEYEEKENDIKRQVKEIKKIVDKKNKDIEK